MTMALILATEVWAMAPTANWCGRRSTPQILANMAGACSPVTMNQAWLSERGIG